MTGFDFATNDITVPISLWAKEMGESSPSRIPHMGGIQGAEKPFRNRNAAMAFTRPCRRFQRQRHDAWLKSERTPSPQRSRPSISERAASSPAAQADLPNRSKPDTHPRNEPDVGRQKLRAKIRKLVRRQTRPAGSSEMPRPENEQCLFCFLRLSRVLFLLDLVFPVLVEVFMILPVRHGKEYFCTGVAGNRNVTLCGRLDRSCYSLYE